MIVRVGTCPLCGAYGPLLSEGGAEGISEGGSCFDLCLPYLTSRETCRSCGRCNWVPAIDNDGHRYMGCNNCTIVIPDELAAGLPQREVQRELARRKAARGA